MNTTIIILLVGVVVTFFLSLYFEKRETVTYVFQSLSFVVFYLY